MAVADPQGASTSSQIQETSHSPEASESVPPSEDNVQVAVVPLEPEPEPAQPETSVSEPDKDAQTTQEAGNPVDGEAGQVPLSHPDKQPSTSATIGSTPAPSEAEPALGGSAEKEKEREKDKESSSATLSLTIPSLRKRTRKRDDRSTTEGKYAASHTTEGSPSISEGEPKTKKTKASLLAKITQIFTSCVGPSPRTHAVDLDEGPSQGRADQKDPEKHSTKDVEMAEQQPSREASSSTSTGDLNPTAPARPLIVVPPPTISDPDIVVPPTPTKQLLPLSETDGLTSGAVQPPGSTGEEHYVVSTEPGEESDGSYSDDEVFTAALRAEELEDEEQRLIKQGGAGLPIGPDGKPKPLLPPISPKYEGRKCLVLDLDETLVHSSLRPVPSPDFIVPVEIEYTWHNFYVLKRPGVDNFLKRMGELYEVVVFTASLSKYADPVLDRLDPERTVAHRLFRESCYNHRGNYVKDLSQLGRPIADTIILDNSPASYIFHPHNAVPVSSWFSDVHDTELSDMCPFLADLATANDVRGILNPTV
ncbi:hypothetical protein QCA50_004089 [Cerrena zonata]|uniref:FCP1 homology domain-containing protein n=1 Tax=Cerrena zonata TaxID=2478898 RepID=A0AAW0GMX1_9APHY